LEEKVKAKDLKVGNTFRTSMGNTYKLLEPVGRTSGMLSLKVEGRKTRLALYANETVTLVQS
jgi:hypothetical protein